jgi:hypothetical protein
VLEQGCIGAKCCIPDEGGYVLYLAQVDEQRTECSATTSHFGTVVGQRQAFCNVSLIDGRSAAAIIMRKLLFPIASAPDVDTTQPPIELVPGTLFLPLKRPGH